MPGNEYVQAVVRALDILETVNSAAQPLSLAQVAERVGLKPTTTHNLVRTLVHRGYLEKVTQPVRFRAGPAVAGLIQDYCRDSLLARAEVVLAQFAESYPAASPILCQYLHGEIVVRLRLQPERPGVIERPLHAVMHPYGTASGVLFQALMTEEERAIFRSRHRFWEHGAHLWGTEAVLSEALAQVRRRGISAPWPEGKNEVLPVAAPILRPNGELVAGLGASIPLAALAGGKGEHFVTAVRRAADRLSTQY